MSCTIPVTVQIIHRPSQEQLMKFRNLPVVVSYCNPSLILTIVFGSFDWFFFLCSRSQYSSIDIEASDIAGLLYLHSLC